MIRKTSLFFTRTQRGERRVSPALYKFLLTAHIIVSVGWLGIVAAKFVLGLRALMARSPERSAILVQAAEALDVAFPVVALATILTGVLLSLGTRWGLLEHIWVVTKFALSFGVILSAVWLGGYLQHLKAAPAAGSGLGSGVALTPTALLVTLAVVHLLMLGAATVISVYKPWGKTWLGQRKSDAAKVAKKHTAGVESRGR